MIDINAIFEAIGDYDVRYSVLRDYSNDMSIVLGKFGLTPDKSFLRKKSRKEALVVLIRLLWKEQAYSEEIMPKEQAEKFAHQIFDEHEHASNQYLSNVSSDGQGWSPLTESTFDSGIIISNETTHKHFCIWFEDED